MRQYMASAWWIDQTGRTCLETKVELKVASGLEAASVLLEALVTAISADLQRAPATTFRLAVAEAEIPEKPAGSAAQPVATRRLRSAALDPAAVFLFPRLPVLEA